MKKNITINLCGRLFQIDEDAYEMLQKYIESLRQSFGKQEGGDEIVADIEARIAELFDELHQQGTEAITIEHVKDIISRIGKPEQLAGDDEQQENGTRSKWEQSARSAGEKIYDNVRSRTAGKKLYRNPKDKMLAGVLSGLAAYTDTDPVIWRLVTVLFTLCYGAGLILYIILAIVLPEASTPDQLLQMEGKEVTPQNLADVVVDKEQQPVQQHNLLRNLLSIVLKIAFGFFVFIAIMVCLLFSIMFFVALIATVCALVLPAQSNIPFSLGAMGLAGVWAENPTMLCIFVAALFLILLIPIYAIIHMMLTLAKKTQPMSTVQRIVWIILWVIAVCTAVPLGFTISDYHQQFMEKRFKAERTNVYQGIEMDIADSDFLRQGGWNLLKAENCAHYTSSGEYYNGNTSVGYLDAWSDDCQEVYQAERKEAIEPGIYRLDCIARTEGPGAYIYAMGDSKLLKQIPVYGNIGGELWQMIQQQKANNQQTTADSLSGNRPAHFHMKIMGLEINIDEEGLDLNDTNRSAVEQGLGWSVVSIDNIVATGDSIAYGVSTDKAFTNQPCRTRWFSVTDFKLTRTGDLPKSAKPVKSATR